MVTQKMTLSMLSFLGVFLFLTTVAQATTYYVRPDGGTNTQCTGLVDAAYPGSGSLQPCALNHPNWVLAPQGSNPSKLIAGDTLVIDGSGKAQYMIGYGSPNTKDTTTCYPNWPWDCYLRAVPSGLDAAHPTRILGKGWDKGCTMPPQLWGTERVSTVLNLNKSNNVEIQCLEITDHSDCQENGPKACNRTTYPYGLWASKGLSAMDSSNVLMKNVNIHGIAHTGVYAGRLKDWTIQDTKIVANSFVGWNGDIGAGVSSNSGTLAFDHVNISYNGCGETYPGLKPYNCYSQSQGGYGDGLGTHKTSGNWVFTNSDVSHNVSDGIDLLYHDGTGTVSIKRTRTEGNAGNQIKSSTDTTIDNSVVIGNCAYFKGNPITWKSETFDYCRAMGSSIALGLKKGINISITNSTVTSNGDTIIMTAGSSCDGTEKIKSINNIYLGQTFYWRSSDQASMYYAAGKGGNGDGPCGTVKVSDDYSIIYGTKSGIGDCTGKAHSKCVDPKLVEPLVSYYTGDQYNVNLQLTSPAIGAGLTIAGASGLDFNGSDRGSVWDIGAMQHVGAVKGFDVAPVVVPPPAPATSSVKSVAASTTASTTVSTSSTSSTTSSTSNTTQAKWMQFFKKN